MADIEFNKDTFLVDSDDGPAVVFIAQYQGASYCCCASAIALRELNVDSLTDDYNPVLVFDTHRHLFETAATRLLELNQPSDGWISLTAQDLRVLDGQYKIPD